MLTRRRFLGSMVAAGAGIPGLTDHALGLLVSANRLDHQRSPEDTESGYNPDANPFPGLMEPVFNVKAFGAKGDDATDDSTAFAAANAAAVLVKGTIFIPPGTFRLMTRLTLSDDVHLIGARWGSVLRWPIERQGSGNNGPIKFGKRNVLRDFKLVGPGLIEASQFKGDNAIVATSGTGITDALRGSVNGTMQRLWITGFNGNGINLSQYTAYMTVRECFLHQIGGEGIYQGPNSDYNDILFNRVIDTEYNGIDSNGSYTKVKGNLVRNIGHLFDPNPPSVSGDSTGIIVFATTGVGPTLEGHSIEDNYISNARAHGISIAAGGKGIITDASIHDNRVTACGVSGIVVDSQSLGSVVACVSVKGNESWNNAHDGYYIHATEDVEVVGNRSHGNKRNGIRLEDGGANKMKRTRVRGNVTKDNGSGTEYEFKIQDGTPQDTEIADNSFINTNPSFAASVQGTRTQWGRNYDGTDYNVRVRYSARITFRALFGEVFQIVVTDGNAFTINAPTSPIASKEILIDIYNNSGGTMGTISWNTVFKMNDAFTNPANGQRRRIRFRYDGTNWRETWRQAADQPN